MLFTITVMESYKYDVVLASVLRGDEMVFVPTIENCGMLSFFDHRADLSSESMEGALLNSARAVRDAILMQRGEI